MTRVQILILVILAVTVCIVFGIAAVVVQTQFIPSLTPVIADQPPAEVALTPTVTATWTPIPTSTATPTPTDTPLPTPTYTRVVNDTATPTPTHTPLPTDTATITPTPTRGRGGSPGARPTPTPTSRYPFRIVETPLEYKTKNFIFVVYARVTSGDVLLPGYRLVGTHYPTGVNIKSEPSCAYLCRASGPKVEDSLIQEANLVFEAFFYDTGTWSMMLVDGQGQQVSEVFHVNIDIKDRKWFYYHFNR
ncbi:MAG: hypothetical protein Kow0063_17950 [Anaerolineae bacterium]